MFSRKGLTPKKIDELIKYGKEPEGLTTDLAVIACQEAFATLSDTEARHIAQSTIIRSLLRDLGMVSVITAGGVRAYRDFDSLSSRELLQIRSQANSQIHQGRKKFEMATDKIKKVAEAAAKDKAKGQGRFFTPEEIIRQVERELQQGQTDAM
ncbi:hypothetical protein [Dethiosulfovibrio salsuginis]|uniref:Uncharacterized protein n=1 Tax=Dethiosulfovibrio salsuginis TaxID=561720 RepID=A0A1X7KIA2_9BACT|nr:hypothetical protein [Dethiosulfovibrio salsuginis]SMG40802.1 hypothetical protein SAMN06275492_12829 [Dethiosulfovibrio salsuginis]